VHLVRGINPLGERRAALGAGSHPRSPTPTTEQFTDQNSGAAGIAEDKSIGHPRRDQVCSTQFREITQRITIAVSRRIVERAAVEFDDHPRLALAFGQTRSTRRR
jgi:hypothetical protein